MPTAIDTPKETASEPKPCTQSNSLGHHDTAPLREIKRDKIYIKTIRLVYNGRSVQEKLLLASPTHWTQPKPTPAPRGLETQLQARRLSKGVRGMVWWDGLDHQSLLGELGGPVGPTEKSQAFDLDPTHPCPCSKRARDSAPSQRGVQGGQKDGV